MPAGAVGVRPASTGDVGLILSDGSATGSATGAGAAPDPQAWPVLDLLAYRQPGAPQFAARSTLDRPFNLLVDHRVATQCTVRIPVSPGSRAVPAARRARASYPATEWASPM